jgi:hypothetical protein
MKFRAKSSKMGDRMIIYIPKTYYKEFKKPKLVEVEIVEDKEE